VMSPPAMKAYSVKGINFNPVWTSELYWGGQLHVSAVFPRGNCRWYPAGLRWSGPQSRSDCAGGNRTLGRQGRVQSLNWLLQLVSVLTNSTKLP
jgi:hypothetical protein